MAASMDRFGNPTNLSKLTQAQNRKTGEVYSSIYKGYFESGSQLFKVEVSPCNKESKDGRGQMWCKVTKVKRNSNMGGNGYSRGNSGTVRF